MFFQGKVCIKFANFCTIGDKTFQFFLNRGLFKGRLNKLVEGKILMESFSFFKKMLFFIFSLALCYAVEWGASFFTQSSVANWYVSLKKPFWNPPDIAFPIVWTILYTLMGVSFGIILCNPNAYTFSVFLAFFVQIFLNFTWSFSFFYMESPALGLVNILLLFFAIVWNIYVFNLHSQLAAILLIPYFLWVAYAISLNLAICYLN